MLLSAKVALTRVNFAADPLHLPVVTGGARHGNHVVESVGLGEGGPPGICAGFAAAIGVGNVPGLLRWGELVAFARCS